MAPYLCDEVQGGSALESSVIVSDVSASFGEAPCNSGASIPMGLGPIGDGSVQFKRKFRWTFEVEYCCASGGKQVGSAFVKSGSRPKIAIDELEINFLNGVTWIPGKAKWQEITFTYYDVSSGNPTLGGAGTNGLLGWLASVYNFTDPVCLTMGNSPSNYAGVARLTLYDGCGTPLEAWILENVWPKEIDWGELDMGTSDECTIALTIRYTNVQYVSYCPPGSIDICPCTPCPAV